MGPQVFTAGIPQIRPQNGLTPLEAMLAKPIQFVRETMSAASNHDEIDLFNGNDAKRRKVMSLAEYYARKNGTYVEEDTTPQNVSTAATEAAKPIEKAVKKANEMEKRAQKLDVSPSPSKQSLPQGMQFEFVVPEGENVHMTPEVVSIPPPEDTPMSDSPSVEESPISMATQTAQTAESTTVDITPPITALNLATTPERPKKRLSEVDGAEAESAVKRLKVATGEKAIISPNALAEAAKAAAKTNDAAQALGEVKSNKRKRDEPVTACTTEKSTYQAGRKFRSEFPENFKLAKAKGIPNKGLWCYRNSIIQALVHVPEIYDFLTNHHTIEKCKRKLPECICCLLAIFAKTHFDNDRAVSGKVRALEQIDKLLGGDFAKVGFRHEQQDADEYALRMLDKAMEQLKSGDKKARTPLEDLLEITTAQSVICRNPKCKHRSQTKSHSTSVRAKLPKGQPSVSLKEIINDLSSSEPIKDYKCEKCGKLGATIRRRFTELPPALLVHINRGGKANFRGQSVKLNNWVKFEPELEIETGDGVSHKYVLRSVVSHMGATLNSGHYVCFAKNPIQSTWSLCDDSNVSHTSEAKFIGSKERPKFSAYILMYTKA